MASLIQQRMAIDRQRAFGTLYVVMGLVFMALSISMLVVSRASDWAGFAFLATSIFWLVSGLLRRRAATRARLAFEAENGEQAGRQ